jgi:geranylgeranyl diphosphate synthase type I
MTPEPNANPASSPSNDLPALGDRVDLVLMRLLDRSASELRAHADDSAALVEAIARLVRAGGKRLRPAFCYWGYRAGGRVDGDAIVRAAAAMELLHVMALLHDDLMDGAAERRGQPAADRWFAAEAARRDLRVDPKRFGWSAALLAGDLAAVLADRSLLESGFSAEAIVRAQVPYNEMRVAMATGQFLDVAGLATDATRAREIARLKGGAYTVEGPLQVGAALAGAGDEVREPLHAYGRALGEAFQLRDDLVDGDAAPGVTAETVNGSVAEARAVLVAKALDPVACVALDALAGSVAMP